MFKEARIKLTAWYLAIIMAISLSFSAVIYIGVNRELSRFDVLVHVRQNRTDQIALFLRNNGLPVPPEIQTVENETLEAARARILEVLGLINVSILIVAGAGGYFLAGQTLDPIKKNMDEQKEFISNASHELRTPLTSLTSEIEVALRDKNLSSSDAKDLLRSNLEDVKKMSKLSNYLLELNRFENKAKELPMEHVDLAEIAAIACGKKKVVKNLKKVIVAGNSDSLAELVTILLDNAFKYSPKNPKIKVTTGMIDGHGFIQVEDNGVGVSGEDLPHIFDRFYRSDKSRGTDGYGLGLSIAKSIVDAHRGKISVESKAGKGTKFTVVI